MQLSDKLYLSYFEIPYSECSVQLLRHNVSMGCLHSVLRHCTHPTARIELNNEKTEYVPWVEIKPQFF
jgi:hypothetical protein